MLDLTILTIAVYTLANSFTYYLGNSQCKQPPLHDVIHNILPNLSDYVHVRDWILMLFFIPFLWTKQKKEFAEMLWSSFLLIVLVKAISIFFTYIPSSNPNCHEKNYLNHCHHNSTSGHASLCLMLIYYYVKFGVLNQSAYVLVALYCILIAMTRAHYTVDIFQGIIISYLICSLSTCVGFS